MIYTVNGLASQIARDSDGDYLGLAIVGVENGQGEWQYNRAQSIG